MRISETVRRRRRKLAKRKSRKFPSVPAPDFSRSVCAKRPIRGARKPLQIEHEIEAFPPQLAPDAQNLAQAALSVVANQPIDRRRRLQHRRERVAHEPRDANVVPALNSQRFDDDERVNDVSERRGFDDENFFHCFFYSMPAGGNAQRKKRSRELRCGNVFSDFENSRCAHASLPRIS